MFNGYEIWKADVEKCHPIPNDESRRRHVRPLHENIRGTSQNWLRSGPFRWAAMHLRGSPNGSRGWTIGLDAARSIP